MTAPIELFKAFGLIDDTGKPIADFNVGIATLKLRGGWEPGEFQQVESDWANYLRESKLRPVLEQIGKVKGIPYLIEVGILRAEWGVKHVKRIGTKYYLVIEGRDAEPLPDLRDPGAMSDFLMRVFGIAPPEYSPRGWRRAIYPHFGNRYPDGAVREEIELPTEAEDTRFHLDLYHQQQTCGAVVLDTPEGKEAYGMRCLPDGSGLPSYGHSGEWDDKLVLPFQGLAKWADDNWPRSKGDTVAHRLKGIDGYTLQFRFSLNGNRPKVTVWLVPLGAVDAS